MDIAGWWFINKTQAFVIASCCSFFFGRRVLPFNCFLFVGNYRDSKIDWQTILAGPSVSSAPAVGGSGLGVGVCANQLIN